jgi:hypothetical protein
MLCSISKIQPVLAELSRQFSFKVLEEKVSEEGCERQRYE